MGDRDNDVEGCELPATLTHRARRYRGREDALGPIDVFVGYTSADQAEADAIIRALQAHEPNVSVWWMMGDNPNPHGMNVTDASLVAVGKASHAVFVVSSTWLSRDVCMREFAAAIESPMSEPPYTVSLLVKDRKAFKELHRLPFWVGSLSSCLHAFWDEWSASEAKREAWLEDVVEDVREARLTRGLPPLDVASIAPVTGDVATTDESAATASPAELPDYRGVAYEIVSRSATSVSFRLIAGCPAANRIARALLSGGRQLHRGVWKMSVEEFESVFLPLVDGEMRAG